MRIVDVLTSMGMGGAERQVVALADRMTARGHTVSLMVLRSRREQEWPTTVPVLYLEMPKSIGGLLKGLSRGSRFLRSFHPDLVHSHTFYANLLVRLLKLFVSAPRILSTIHNVYEGGWLRIFAYRLTDPLSCGTTAVSEAVAAEFIRRKAVPWSKCRVLTNGIDTAEFAPDAQRRLRMRARMSVSSEFLWLAAGRLVPAKDFSNLLRAFARVSQGFPDTLLWIAGEVAETGFKQAGNFDGVPDRVRWLGLRRDLPALLDAADGFVLSSAWEGMPLVVGEAMAMEKPVVATDVGGVRELVGCAGVVVPAKSPIDLAEAMMGLMRAAPGDRRSLGAAARARILENFNMDSKADEWETLYLSILGRTS